MNKIFWLLLGFCFLPFGLQAKKMKADVKIINNKNFNVALYSGINFNRVFDSDFLKRMQNENNYDAIEKRVFFLDDAISAELKGNLTPGVMGWQGRRVLGLTVVLMNLTGGRRGRVQYEFRFWDGSKIVAIFDVSLDNRSGSITDPTGRRHRAYIPGKLVEVANDFLAGRTGDDGADED